MGYYEEGEQYFLHAYGRYDTVLDHGEGVYLYDTEGNKYKAVITSENENTLAFLKAGETIHIRYIEMNDVNVIKSVGE